MSKVITNEMYINKLKQKNPDIVPCEEYIKSTTPIMHHCLKHDIFWKISPSNALKGKGCAACRSEKLKKRFLKTAREMHFQTQFIRQPLPRYSSQTRTLQKDSGQISLMKCKNYKPKYRQQKQR